MGARSVRSGREHSPNLDEPKNSPTGPASCYSISCSGGAGAKIYELKMDLAETRCFLEECEVEAERIVLYECKFSKLFGFGLQEYLSWTPEQRFARFSKTRKFFNWHLPELEEVVACHDRIPALRARQQQLQTQLDALRREHPFLCQGDVPHFEPLYTLVKADVPASKKRV